MDGVVHTYKARLVANGFTQTYGLDYEETFYSVADIRAIRCFAIKDLRKAAYILGIKIYRDRSSQFQQNPVDLYWTIVKNILKYLRNTNNLFLVYGGDIKRELKVSFYTDVGYLTDADDIKYHTGYVFVLNGGDVDWKSTKQIIFATSFVSKEDV
nr:hypothetical protein [Tanacetum cinerariifolium]